MLEASLSQLEQLVSDLVQQNQDLLGTNESLKAELARAKDENDSLQLNLMEQEEKQDLAESWDLPSMAGFHLPVFTAFQVRVIRRTAAWDWLFWVNKRCIVAASG